MLVGWWLLYCVVVYTGFESALISHLTVNRARTLPPETLEDLVNADGWSWALDVFLWTGVPLEYFTRHKDPVVMKINQHLEIISVDKGLEKILKGGFSLLDTINYVTIEANSRYGDGHDRLPFFISKKTVSMLSIFANGFRIGAPFYRRFNKLVLQLHEAGIVTKWLGEVIQDRIKENRARTEMETGKKIGADMKKEEAEVVLGLDHLQGAFYLLSLGCTAAVVSLLGEYFAYSRS